MAVDGRWEVVARKTKPNATNNNNAKNEALVYLEKMPHLLNNFGSLGKESKFEVLSSNTTKTKTRTNNNNSDKVNEDPSEKLKNGSAIPVAHKKQPKKKSEAKVHKTPKTMDDALTKVTVQELRTVIAMVQTRFVHSSNMWLAELVAFFNEKLNVETTDPLFASKNPNYPLSALSKDVRKIVENTISKCTKPILKEFFDKTLSLMVSEMLKGARVNGQRLVLQAMIRQDPSLVGDDFVMFVNYRNMHQNRQNISETILWLASVAGTKSFDVGIKVWLQFLLPMIGIKSYSKFVVDYFCSLFSWHSKEPNYSDAVGPQQFYPVLDIVFNNSAKLPPNLHRNMIEVFPKFKRVAFGHTPEKNLRNFFPTFLSRLDPSVPEQFKSELLECLMYCLKKDTKCYVLWLRLYTRHFVQSSLLLEHLVVNWNKLGTSQILLKETLGELSALNTKLSTNLKDGNINGLPLCKQHCKTILSKMSSVSTSPSSKGLRSSSSDKDRIRRRSDNDDDMGGFGVIRPFVFVLFVVLASAVFYDCQIHGSFKDSKTGRVLNEYGVVSAYDEVSSRVKVFYGEAYTWTTTNVPIYVGMVKQLCQPYTRVFWEWFAIARMHFFDSLLELHVYLTTTIPIVLERVDERFPGAVHTATSYFDAAWSFTFKLSSTLMTALFHYAQVVGAWLGENVFTGELAVDKLQNHLYRAVDTIQAYAVDAVNWVEQQLKTDANAK